MPTQPFARAPRLLLFACALALTHGCARTAQPTPTPAADSPPPRAQATEKTDGEEAPPSSTVKTSVEEPPPPADDTQTILDDVSARRPRDLPPPTDAEVGSAVERVFKGAALVENNRKPYYVVGDFNGDSSEDVAVVVRPAPGRVAELNDELANWMLVAPVRQPPPRSLPYPEAHARALERRRVLAEESDVLVAVIHGHEAGGWRDARATQTYVLTGAAGEKLKTRERRQLFKSADRKRLPRLRGDVIAADLAGHNGFLFYNGAKYEWYDPQSYTPPAPARIVHGGATTASTRP